jgi:methionyl-tRNA formyltransferase
VAGSAVVLYVMTRKGVAVLEGLISRFGAAAIGRVVGARDAAVAQDHFQDIERLAAGNGIAFFERAAAPPLAAGEGALAIGWRWLIRGSSRLAIVHDSLLPRYRGFAPLVSCLINGEREIGATALLAADRYDEGDILGQASVAVDYPLRIAQAIELLIPLYVQLAGDVVGRMLSGEPLVGRPQDHARASYSLWRDEADYNIDWTGPAAEIRRLVDAVGHPYRGASTLVDGCKVRVLQAEERADVVVENRVPGKVIFVEDGLPVVVCGQGLLKIGHLVDDQSGVSLLPLAKFRTRFG